MIEAVNKDIGMSPYFTKDDEYLMQTFSSICSLVSTARSVDVSVVTDDADNPNAAFAASASLANETDLNTLVYQMMKKVQEMVKADRCAVFLIDEERHELWSSIAEGAPEIRIPINTVNPLSSHISIGNSWIRCTKRRGCQYSRGIRRRPFQSLSGYQDWLPNSNYSLYSDEKCQWQSYRGSTMYKQAASESNIQQGL
jgi:hypothetical protein